ncbi:MAG: hypothetical protein JJE25_04565 [Bacteroidia bacterium]|nr:hypothetical protein [Bacteroidia bacterium]
MSELIKHRAMNVARYFFVSLLTLGLTFILVALAITFFYEEEVKRYVTTEINKELNAKVTVVDMDLSLLRNFPDASMVFIGVIAMDALPENEILDTLFSAQELFLKFNLLDIFRKKIVVRKLELQHGFIRLRINKDGTDNFQILKVKEKSSSTRQAINLKEVIFDDIRFRYNDMKEDFYLSAVFNHARMSGKLTDEKFSVNSENELFIDRISSGKNEFLQNREASVSVTADVNTSSGSFEISAGKIKLKKLLLDVSGKTVVKETDRYYSFEVKSNHDNLSEFSELLPGEIKKHFQNFRYEGKGIFHAVIAGNTGEKKNISLKINGEIISGKVKHKENIQPLENINAKCDYELNVGRNKTFSSLNISQFTALLNKKPVNGNLRIDDFLNPFLSLNVTADLDLKTLQNFFPLDTLSSLKGNAKINLSFAGKTRDVENLNSAALGKIKSSGTLLLENVSFGIRRNPLQFNDFNANCTFHDNDIEVKSFTGKISGTDFTSHGTLYNLFSFLLSPVQTAHADVTLRSRILNLDELLERDNSSSSQDTSYKLRFSPNLSAAITVDVEHLVFRRFKAEKFNGVLTLNKQILSTALLSFSSMKGSVKMSGAINAARHDSLLISCIAKISGLDIRELFYEMENFQQNTLTDKNIRGRADIDLQFTSRWSSDLRINPKKVVLDGSVKIFNGELIDFAPVLALSRFIKVSELQHVKFSTLQNNIQIYDRKVFIPSMEIKSSALNLTASGSHTFDNKVDYSLRLLLSEILGKKARENNTEFGVVEDDGLGKASLFLHMTGDAGNPKFTYDKKAVMKKIQNEIKTEKQTLKNLLKQEFGTKKDSASTKQKKEAVEIDWDNNP